MENIEKEGHKKPKRFLAIGLIAFISLIILIILGFIFTSTDTGKKVLSESSEKKQETEKGELDQIKPASVSESKETETTSEKKTSTSSGGGGGGGGGGSGASETNAEESASTLGKLELINKIDPGYTSGIYRIIHYPEGAEELDDLDGRYSEMYDPSGIAAKIVSTIEGTEIDTDVRPLNSTSSVELELSLISESGTPITISSENELRLSFPLINEGYDFGDKEITLSVNGADYNVRQLISEGGGTGVIPLPNLDRTYNSGEVYETVTVSFS